MKLTSINLTAADGRERPFFLRTDSHGDQGVVQKIFANREYAVPSQVHYDTVLAWLAGQTKTPLILDLGANIGASAVWFSMRFPQAHVIAVEPEHNNFRLLQQNTTGLNVACVQGAVGNGLPAFLTDPGQGDWGFRINHKLVPGAAQVASYTVPQLLGSAPPGTVPFLCKIDVEGSEAEIFADVLQRGWVDDFAVLMIELHDWMLPGEGTSRCVLRTIAALDFDVLLRGENLMCFNNKLLRLPPA